MLCTLIPLNLVIPENVYSIEFSVGCDNNIEFVSIHESEEITEDMIRNLLKTVIDSNLLFVGERSEGSVDISEEGIVFDYRYCSEVGEDWDSDVWNDEILKIENR